MNVLIHSSLYHRSKEHRKNSKGADAVASVADFLVLEDQSDDLANSANDLEESEGEGGFAGVSTGTGSQSDHKPNCGLLELTRKQLH